MTLDPLADVDREIIDFLQAAGIAPDDIQLQIPKQREFGERATNVSRLAKTWRKGPPHIAAEITGRFDPANARFIESVEPAGGFINVRLKYRVFIPHVIESVRAAGPHFGQKVDRETRSIVVEHTSVNPNKEMHIGHVRNAVLGDVVARLLRLAGDDVQVQNYIDDTGVQAAISVLALQDFPEARLPGEKYDHFVGRGYVKINAELGAEESLKKRLVDLEASASPADAGELESVKARLQNVERLKKKTFGVMRELEEGHFHEITEGIVNAQLETVYRLGIYYDLLNWESHLVQSHIFQEAMKRLEDSPTVYRPSEGRYAGTLSIETGDDPAPGEERKCEVLIRSNGLPTYVGKDIAYHMWKFHLLPDRLGYVEYAHQPNGEVLWSTSIHGEHREEEPPDGVINMIDVGQSLPQQAVKEGLRAAGFEQAAGNLYHLPYGIVKTPEGRISGRKGTTVSGDAVIDEAVRVALERVREKRSQDLTDEEMEHIAEAVGVGAVRYFMAQYNPLREIIFDVSNVVSYDGNTALYIQYALVRMSAILRRARTEHGVTDEAVDAADTGRLEHEQEKRLAYHLAQYPDLVTTAARTLAVNLVAEYAFDLATIFNAFYRDCGVLNAEPGLREARLLLVRTVRDVLANACGVLGVPVIERL